MPSAVLPSGDHFELADDGAAHGGFGDAVVRQDVGLAFGGGGAVAPHGGEEERPHPLFQPILHHAAYDGGDIVDAAAADADGDARPRRHARGKAGRRQFPSHLAGNIGQSYGRQTSVGSQGGGGIAYLLF